MLLSLYSSTPSSLIIVDEFGKGTTEIDGLALLTSCLDHFLSREEKCPHILAATHFHNVKNLIRKSKYLKFQVTIFSICRKKLLEKQMKRPPKCKAIEEKHKFRDCKTRNNKYRNTNNEQACGIVNTLRNYCYSGGIFEC